MSNPIRRRRWFKALALLLMAAAAYGTYRAVRPNPNLKKVKQLQQQFTSEEARAWTPEERRAKGQEMRAAMENLSAKQREALEAERQQRQLADLQHYASLTPAERTRHLDQLIDRMEKMRMEMAQRNPQGKGPNGRGGPPGGRGMGGDFQQADKRRKEMLNKTTPELRALQDRFRKDLEQRRQQRGLPATGGFGGPRR